MLRKRKPTSRNVTGLLLILAAEFGVNGEASADDLHLGVIEYEIACMSCHGVEGRGDGKLAKNLKTAPANLTQITRSNHGEFPAEKIVEIIDGRAIVAAHGNRDMPVWGDRYRVSVPGKSPDWVEQRVRVQIRALTNYIKSIQE